MKHLRNALITFYLEACQLVLENVQLGTLHHRCDLISFIQSLLHLISSLTILDLLKHLTINDIVDGVESHYIALPVGLVLVDEIGGINNHIVSLSVTPHT
jgi:hypothetical protein